MIPFSILSGRIQFTDKNIKEVRILDLSAEGFTFRLAQQLLKETISEIELHFFIFASYQYEKITVKNYTLEEIKKHPFYYEYRITILDEGFSNKSQMLMREYLRYIELKLDQGDAQLAKELTGYPAEMEKVYAADFSEQKEQWFEGPFYGEWKDNFKLALELDQEMLYEKYLSMSKDEFCKWYWSYHKMTHHPLAKRLPDILYIGNQYCPQLFPCKDMLMQLIKKAEKEGLKTVIVFSFMQEEKKGFYEEILCLLEKNCLNKKAVLELVLNDWGMVFMVNNRKHKYFSVTMGTLLHKYRKDPRFIYKKRNENTDEMWRKTSVNSKIYREYLENDLGIDRYSYEACGLMLEIVPEKSCLHIPFYQTNTSSYCPLYAVCEYGERGMQGPIEKCPQYCKEKIFLYGKGLNLIGRYNSLFGYYAQILKDDKELHSWLQQGVDRVVVGLL